MNNFCKNHIFSTCLIMLVFIVNSAFSANWQSVGKLNVPSHNYNFLAATPNGDLLATTYYSAPADNPPAPMPALLIRNPASGNPQVLELNRTAFEPNRGYGGAATDEEGNFYVSGDTGIAATSFLKKYNSNGQPDSAFGNRGTVMPGLRCLGIDTFGDYLLVAIEWGRIWIYDKNTGKKMGELDQTPSTFYLRDIAIDPKSLRLFGVSEGSVLTWGGSAPWAPKAYQFRQLTPKRGEARAGEGVSIDPLRRTVLFTPIPGNQLLEMEGSGRVNAYPVSTATDNAHLADSVMSFDGQFLFISDMRERTIHVMQRNVEEAIIAAGNVSQNATTTSVGTTGNTVAPNWTLSYEEVIQDARNRQKPVFVYFRSAGHTEDFENNVLLTDPFNQRANNDQFVCVYEDVSKSRLLAYRFGVFRVPHVTILNPDGTTAKEFTYNINADEMFAVMDRVGGQ